MALTDSWLAARSQRRANIPEGSTFLSSFEIDGSAPSRAGQLRLSTLENQLGLCFLYCSVVTSSGVLEWKKVSMTAITRTADEYLPYGG